MNWKRTAIWITISGGLAAALFFGLRPQPLEVETVAVRIAPLETTVEEEGKTRLRDRFLVSAPLTGVMSRHDWKVGDTLAAGRAVAMIRPTQAEFLDTRRLSENQARLAAASASLEGAGARLRSAQEQLQAAKADAEYWKQQNAREEKLVGSGDIPESRLDRTRSEWKRAEATLRAAEQSVTVAQTEIDRLRAEVAAARAAASEVGPKPASAAPAVAIQSPVAGRVVRVLRQSEGVVSSGEPILELGDTRALEVEVELLSSDAVRVGPGTMVRLTRWGGDGALQARVRLVEPTGFTKISALGVEEQRVRVISDLVSPSSEWERLGEGYRVEAAFVLWSAAQVLQIPASALFREGEKWAVFVVSDGFARKREVEVGHRTGLAAEILSGVQQGDWVIPHPDEKLRDGLAVRRIEKAP